METGGASIEIPSDAQLVEEQMAAVHEAGGYFISNVSVFNGDYQTYQARPELISASVIDINGERMYVPWESTEEEKLWWGNTNDPVYQNYLKGQVNALVDAGVDGILLDEIEGTAGAMGRGGSFGPEDMQGFQAYLSKRYTEEHLLNRYGIDDVNAFDYGNYIRENGWDQAYMQQESWIPLIQDYINFQRMASKDFMSELIQGIRDHANATGAEVPAVSGNLFGFSPHLMLYVDDLDFLAVEYPYIEDGLAPFGHAVPMLKMGSDTGKKSVLFPSVWTGNSLHMWTDTKDLFSLWIMEAYATGNAFFHSERFFAGTGWSGQHQWFEVDTNNTGRIFRFVGDNAFAFENPTPVADVALAYSHASDYYDRTRDDFLGFAYALSDAHVQYDVIFMGDDLRVSDATTEERLNQYSAIVLPSARVLTDRHVNLLTNYVNNGGLLITNEGSGLLDEHGDEANRSSWNSLTAEGARNSGSGRVVSLGQSYGEVYVNERTKELRALVLEPLLERAVPMVESTAPESVHFIFNRTENPAGNSMPIYVVHALNYNFSQFTNQVWETDPFQVTLQLDGDYTGGSNTQLYELSAETETFNLKSFNQAAQNRVTFEVPALSVHRSYLLMDRETARNLADTVDGISEEDYQAALDNAREQNQDTSYVESVYAAMNAAYSNGNYLEARRLHQEVTRTAGRLSRPRVLFDESLDPRKTLSAERALELNSANPDRVRFTTLQQRLGNEIDIVRSVDPITSQLLAGYDVLMLASPTKALTAEQITAIQSYVEHGGSLILLGDANYGWSNGLTEAFGIRLKGEPLSTEEGVNAFGNIRIQPRNSTHESMATAPEEVLFSYAGSLEVQAPAEVVLWTASTAWEDFNRNFHYDEGEAVGPFPVGAAAEYGDGRVFVISDNSFVDSQLRFTANDELMRSILNWLSAADGPGTGGGNDDGNNDGGNNDGGNNDDFDDFGDDLSDEQNWPDADQQRAVYMSWASFVFGGSSEVPSMEATLWGPNADPDRDGHVNYIEFLAGRNPMSAGLIEQRIDRDESTNTMTISMPWAGRQSGQIVNVLYSDGGNNWEHAFSVRAVRHTVSTPNGRELRIAVPWRNGYYRLEFPIAWK